MKGIIAIFFLALLAIGAAVGLMAIMGKSSTTPFVDSYNGTTSNSTNSTQDVVISHGTTGTQLAVVAIFVCFGLVLFVGIVAVIRKAI